MSVLTKLKSYMSSWITTHHGFIVECLKDVDESCRNEVIDHLIADLQALKIPEQETKNTSNEQSS